MNHLLDLDDLLFQQLVDIRTKIKELSHSEHCADDIYSIYRYDQNRLVTVTSDPKIGLVWHLFGETLCVAVENLEKRSLLTRSVQIVNVRVIDLYKRLQEQIQAFERKQNRLKMQQILYNL